MCHLKVNDYHDMKEECAFGGFGDRDFQCIGNDYRYFGLPNADGDKPVQAEAVFSFPEEINDYETLYLMVNVISNGLDTFEDSYYIYIYQK